MPSRDVHIIWDVDDDETGNVRHKVGQAQLRLGPRLLQLVHQLLDFEQHANTTLETVSRIAAALGLEIRLSPVSNGRKSRAKQASC